MATDRAQRFQRIRRTWRDARTIAIKDATEMWRDGRFRLASAVVLAILGTVFVAGWSQTTAAARAREEAQRVERDMWLNKGSMNPHAAAHYGAFVFKPVQPLSAIDPGVDPFVGASIFLEAHQQELTRHQPADDASPLRRAGAATVAMALQILVPLLIVVCTAPAFAGERESGTLRQLMSVGVSRGSVIVGKTLGAALPLAAVLVPASMLGVAALWWTTPTMLTADTGVRAAVLVVVYCASFALWAGIGLLVSACARGSKSALAILLGVWFTCGFVVPPIATTLSKRAAVSPASGAAVTAIEEARAALPRWDHRVASVEERFLTGELAVKPGMASNPEVVALAEAETDETALYDRHHQQLFAAFEAQAAAYTRAGLLVPTLAVQTLSMSLAGTDYAHYHRFVAATTAYRRTFLETLTMELASYQALDTFEYAGGREVWQRIPAFVYEAPRAGEVIAANRAAFGTLAGWLLAIGVGLAWRVAVMRVS